VIKGAEIESKLGFILYLEDGMGNRVICMKALGR